MSRPSTSTGDTLTFRLVVTDNTGVASAPDTCVVTVLPANEYVLSGGAWVVAPLILQ